MIKNPWTDEKIALLRSLWEDVQLPTKAIGEQLGFTKNSVIGKARRLNLSSRASPIVRTPVKKKAKAAATPVARSSVKVALQNTPPLVFNPVTFADLRHDMCSWIDSNIIDHEVTFCGRQVLTTQSYCPEHCARGFMKTSQPKQVVDFYTEQDVDDAARLK